MADTSDNITIRRLSLNDAKGVFLIENESFPSPWPIEVIESELRRDGSLNAGYFDGDTLLGYSMNYLVVDELQILSIAVKESQRGRGIARNLLSFILKEAGNSGALHAHLEVRASNLAARGLYQCLGFRIVGERKGYYQDNGETACLMSLELCSIS